MAGRDGETRPGRPNYIAPGEEIDKIGGYMKTTMTEVRTFVVKKYCDCGGLFEFNGRAQMTSPPHFVHQCTDCKDFDTFPQQYPTQETLEVGEEQDVDT